MADNEMRETMPSHHHPPGHLRVARPPSAARERRALRIAIVLTVGFAVIEAAGGWLAGSLALLSDAGHMVTDAAALAIALLAQHVSQRPPSRRASYGYARAEVLAAFINALLMLAVIVWIAVEAVRRLLAPSPVAGGMVMAIAAVGLLVNMFVGVEPVARPQPEQPGRAAACQRRHAGVGSGDRRRRGRRLDRMDADRSDPVSVGVGR